MTADLIAFLRARLDEDEAVARGTTMPLDWHQGPGDDPDWTTSEMVLMWPPEHHTPYEQDKHWRGLTAEPEGLAAHIARHDPARVLAEVEAKRQIVKAHGRLDVSEFCETCDGPSGIPGRPYGCTTVRLLALPYADHPDYRDAWRP
ncbi:DUF6221 family protein [Streptomyces sp. SCA2-2]|uniref:DUF6221 family protein n=1 Tax=Streptomyces sp. SCA2-2 TaxID=1563677 RepID=UPI0010210B0F|nr:DUF6221 family protein [Streptomyces sp. SCA2-2]RZE89168.1 hypothetical protein C0L86_28880 [Streptomyces sp. SCA2-2]